MILEPRRAEAYGEFINIFETTSGFTAGNNINTDRHGSCEANCNMGPSVPKCDSFRERAPSMNNEDRPNEVPTGRSESTALVPLTPRIERRSRRRWYRFAPDPTFVAHLIAEAQRVPQARTLRRASPADAQSAYQTGPTQAQRAGNLMRQVI